MEKELIFQILNISETKDEETIRQAYREILKNTNPEDDPEGFKRLRQAYEEALQLLRRPEEGEESPQPKDEVDLWMDQVEELYQDLFRRCQPELWKELLEDPVCEGLDTSLEAREKIITFLLDHIHLPHKIWKLIDNVFEITADIEALKEKYPVNFLNYMKYYVENETFIPFGLFVYRDDGKSAGGEQINADGYIDEYLRIKRQIDNGEWEGCLQKLDDLKAFHIYHPYEDVERLRIFLEEKQDGSALAENLLDQYGEDIYVRLHAGNSLWEKGEKDRAYELWKGILEQMPNHYTAKYFSVKHLMDKEDFFEARKLLLDLLDIDDRSEELRSYIFKANEALIQELRTTLEEGREDPRLPGDELKLTLGWCLLQNEKREEALEVVESFEPEPEQEYGYVNLYSQLLYFAAQYEKAVPYLNKWMELVEGLTDDGTDETRKRISRKPRIHLLLSSCYYEMGKDEEWEKEGNLSVDTASDSKERIENMHYLANKLLLTEKYERSVDICDRIIEEDGSYYPAYLVRQEACYHMRRAQQVVDDYHNAVDIYSGYYKPYLFAAKVFYNYSQYEDAKNVIDLAKENQVEFSDELKLYEARILRNLSHNMDERILPREILTQLAENWDEENCDIKDRSEIAFERGLICWDDNEFEEALAFLADAISQNPERMQYRIVRGHIYLDMEKYQDALDEYQVAALDYDTPELYYNRGCAYEGLGEMDLAIADYKKTLELNDQYRNTNHKLYDIYKKRFNSKNHKSDYEQALYYINRRLEIKETANAHFYRAMLYSDAMETELALKDYEIYLEEVPDDKALFFNVGLCYRAIGQFEKAIEYFEKAKELKQDSDTFYEIGVCYKALEQYDEALEALEEGIKFYPKDTDLWKQIGYVYENREEYGKAREAFKKMKHFSANKDDAINEIANAWIADGNFRKGRKVLEDGIKDAAEDEKASLYSHLADRYYDRQEYEKAEEFYLQAIAAEKDPFELFDHERYLAMTYYRMGRYEEAERYAKASMDHFQESGRSEEDYIGYKAYSPVRIAIFGWLYLCLGDKERAEESFCKMEEMQPCKFCAYKKCFESTLYRAQLYESQGDYKRAIEFLEETLQRDPICIEAKLNLENIRKKQSRNEGKS